MGQAFPEKPSALADGVVTHASKGFPGWAKDLLIDESRIGQVLNTPPGEITLGAIVGVAWITGCTETARTLENCDISEDEQVFGDWTPGRYAWRLERAQQITPIPIKGALGLWILPDWAALGLIAQTG